VYFDDGPPAHFVWRRDRVFHHETVIVCAEGELRLDPSGLTVVMADGTTERRVQVDADREYTLSFARQYQDLVRTVQDGAPPSVRPVEGREAVAVIEALYASARDGGKPTPV